MKALVTGATGFTGKRLTEILLQKGYDVRVIIRDKKRFLISDNEKLEIVIGDIINPIDVDMAVKDTEIIFHVAALYRTAGVDPKEYWNTHVKATENMLDSAYRYGIKKFIHTSTVGIHGHVEKPPADENYQFKPGDLYQLTKLEGEKKAKEFHEKNGLPLVIIRPSAIYGPGDMRLYKLFKIASKKYSIILGSGEIFYHMVYVDDLAEGMILAAESNISNGEAFIIGGEGYVTLNQLLEIISGILGKQSKTLHLPVAPFQILGSLCEKICIPLGINPPIYRRRVDFFTKSRAFDISKAKKMLGYKPKISLEEGLTKTAQWYGKKGYL
jgi:nucleoside-diphosphate-sugar epimerase